MSKISIISRDDQALLIDISGCSSFKEIIEQLSSTFLNGGQFWQEQSIDLNLGSLLLNKTQAAQIVALTNGIGAKPNRIFAKNLETMKALEALEVTVTSKANTAPRETFVDNAIGEPNLSLSPIVQESEQTIKNDNSAPTEDFHHNEPGSAVNSNIEKVIVFDHDSQIDKQLDAATPRQDTGQTDDSSNATELETSEDRVIEARVAAVPSAAKRSALCLKQTLRAGQALSHKGDLIIIGDVNAGAEVVAEGDITIWGSLRGIAHAGIDGNTKAEIRALRLQPIQIRIANYIARSPDGPSKSSLPTTGSPYTAETAKLVNGKIRIVHSTLEA